ncbi:hypothetical protein HGG76_06710 [Ochrobactrum tritici]|uniref:Uncharacterized protein n=1 Tax=Brucella tritici TaxID=94626 RepID=A0A7X6FRV4_9HYPH|nr:hypothetical protein [Brucella tritici]
MKVHAPIETFGQGARGFNVYTGTVDLAEFDRVITHADGAVGIQISRPIGKLTVRRGIETFGGTGPSLVKGVVVELSAIGLSIKPGGSAREIDIAGGVRTNGKGVTLSSSMEPSKPCASRAALPRQAAASRQSDLAIKGHPSLDALFQNYILPTVRL